MFLEDCKTIEDELFQDSKYTGTITKRKGNKKSPIATNIARKQMCKPGSGKYVENEIYIELFENNQYFY